MSVALAGVLLLTVSGTAFAAKGGKSGTGGSGGTSGVAITVPNGVFGGVTTASVTGASGLWVRAACSAFSGGAMVTWVATDSSGSAVIQLGPTPTWSSGGASCSAQAGSFDARGNWNVAASTTFSVSG
ncbi:MAG TPA: hypothetical protein VFG00_04895 [Acidothermaceae bacterium]|nr:hypothetical protein [Acidothermaceae bacterium]